MPFPLIPVVVAGAAWLATRGKASVPADAPAPDDTPTDDSSSSDFGSGQSVLGDDDAGVSVPDFTMPADPMVIVSSLDALDPGFQPRARALVAELARQGVAVRVFQTRRTLQQQAKAAAEGNSQLTGPNAPHVRGIAMDFVLVPDQIPGGVRRHPQNPAFPDLWDTSTPAAVATWFALGRIAEAAGLVWGGRFGTSNPNVLGWDAGHVQLRSV